MSRLTLSLAALAIGTLLAGDIASAQLPIPGGPDNRARVMEALVYCATTKHSSWFDRSRHPARVRVDFPEWDVPGDAYPHSEEDS